MEYETLPGWKKDISGVRCGLSRNCTCVSVSDSLISSYFEDLPAEARRYVERVEQLVGCSIGWVRRCAFLRSLGLNGFHFPVVRSESVQVARRWPFGSPSRRVLLPGCPLPCPPSTTCSAPLLYYATTPAAGATLLSMKELSAEA